jgi:hypothetical protein
MRCGAGSRPEAGVECGVSASSALRRYPHACQSPPRFFAPEFPGSQSTVGKIPAEPVDGMMSCAGFPSLPLPRPELHFFLTGGGFGGQ